MEYRKYTFLYRCWSPRSAGKLRSGKLNQGRQAIPLTNSDAISEFQRHRDELNQVPTALVATTNHFLKVLHRALKLTWRGVAPNDIIIAIIAPDDTRVYHGREISKAAGNSDDVAYQFRHDYFYAWEIPVEQLVHTVTLGTVLRRGFSLTSRCPDLDFQKSLAWRSPDEDFPEYKDLEHFVVRETCGWRWRYPVEYLPDSDPYGTGYRCGLDACSFGLRAPVRQIAGVLSAYQLHLHRAPNWWLKKLVKGMEDAVQATEKGCREDVQAPKSGSHEEKLRLQYDREYWRLAGEHQKLVRGLKSLPEDKCTARDRTKSRIAEILVQTYRLQEVFFTDTGY